MNQLYVLRKAIYFNNYLTYRWPMELFHKKIVIHTPYFMKFILKYL